MLVVIVVVSKHSILRGREISLLDLLLGRGIPSIKSDLPNTRIEEHVFISVVVTLDELADVEAVIIVVDEEEEEEEGRYCVFI